MPERADPAWTSAPGRFAIASRSLARADAAVPCDACSASRSHPRVPYKEEGNSPRSIRARRRRACFPHDSPTNTRRDTRSAPVGHFSTTRVTRLPWWACACASYLSSHVPACSGSSTQGPTAIPDPQAPRAADSPFPSRAGGGRPSTTTSARGRRKTGKPHPDHVAARAPSRHVTPRFLSVAKNKKR